VKASVFHLFCFHFSPERTKKMIINREPRRPLIGLTTYRKTTKQSPPVTYLALMPSYVEAVEAAGGTPVMIPLGLSDESLLDLFNRLDGLVLTGGGDIAGRYYRSEHLGQILDVDEDRDHIELTLARAAVDQDKPLLAICRGHQVLNVALDGTLYEDVFKWMPGAIKHDFFGKFPRDYRAHAVTIEPGSKLALALGRTEAKVNSLHHQGIRDLAPRLTATAYAPDGLIESVEVTDHPFAVGVQWHPENLIAADSSMLSLFRGLVDATERVRP